MTHVRAKVEFQNYGISEKAKQNYQ